MDIRNRSTVEPIYDSFIVVFYRLLEFLLAVELFYVAVKRLLLHLLVKKNISYMKIPPMASRAGPMLSYSLVQLERFSIL